MVASDDLFGKRRSDDMDGANNFFDVRMSATSNAMTMVGGADAFSRVEEYEVLPTDTLTQIAYKFKAS